MTRDEFEQAQQQQQIFDTSKILELVINNSNGTIICADDYHCFLVTKLSVSWTFEDIPDKEETVFLDFANQIINEFNTNTKFGVNLDDGQQYAINSPVKLIEIFHKSILIDTVTLKPVLHFYAKIAK